METYQTISIIEASPTVKYMFEYDKNNALCIGETNSYFFINFDENKIKNVSKWEGMDSNLYSIILSRDKNWFISIGDKKLIMMNIETNEFYQIEIESKGCTFSLFSLDDHHFLTRDEGHIRFWQY